MIGRLLRNNEVLADNVDCMINRDYRRDDGQDGWWGETWLPLDVHLLPGDKVTWQPAGGAPAGIVIERITVDGRLGRMLVRFSGTEPSREEDSKEGTG